MSGVGFSFGKRTMPPERTTRRYLGVERLRTFVLHQRDQDAACNTTSMNCVQETQEAGARWGMLSAMHALDPCVLGAGIASVRELVLASLPTPNAETTDLVTMLLHVIGRRFPVAARVSTTKAGRRRHDRRSMEPTADLASISSMRSIYERRFGSLRSRIYSVYGVTVSSVSAAPWSTFGTIPLGTR